MLHNLGRVVATAALAAAVPHHQITTLHDRHARGDWGELVQAAND
ncbi:MAG: hypothetical protein ACKO45_00375 [Cyanobium sp.]